MNQLFSGIADGISSEVGLELEVWESEFMHRVYSTDCNLYLNRLRAIGMLGRGTVLDAGCGFGQWLLCLAGESEEVHGMDVLENRVHATQTAIRLAGIDNAKVMQGALESIPAEDETYDAIFAYSSLCCVPWKQGLSEFHRVLKPGGRVYFTADDIGYALLQWQEQPNRSENYDPRQYTVWGLDNTLHYERTGELLHPGYVLISPDQARDYLEEIGFRVEQLADEGTINEGAAGAPKPQPFFPGTYQGLTACYEVLAVKKD